VTKLKDINTNPIIWKDRKVRPCNVELECQLYKDINFTSKLHFDSLYIVIKLLKIFTMWKAISITFQLFWAPKNDGKDPKRTLKVQDPNITKFKICLLGYLDT